MNMYNNLPQTVPAYFYAQNYQKAPVQTQELQPQIPAYLAPQQNYIKGRPVVSIDEARASQIDLDGSLYVFPDLGNKKIYTKQINMDGTASFNIFELSEDAPKESAPVPSYVTRDELNAILAELKLELVQPRAPQATAAAQKPTFNL